MKIFLDDVRDPSNCLGYMHMRIGPHNLTYKESWYVVRNYPEFVKAVDRFAGEITHVSFDHDLADGHYHQNMQDGVLNYESEDFSSNDYNKTGYHAAKYLKKLYGSKGLELPMMFVHSMNPVGTENIVNLFK